MLEKKSFSFIEALAHRERIFMSRWFFTAAFGLFHFGPFVSIYFFSLIHLCI